MNYQAIIAAVVSVGSAASIAFGKPALAAVISDPNTATTLTGLIGVLGGIVSAISGPVHKPQESAK